MNNEFVRFPRRFCPTFIDSIQNVCFLCWTGFYAAVELWACRHICLQLQLYSFFLFKFQFFLYFTFSIFYWNFWCLFSHLKSDFFPLLKADLGHLTFCHTWKVRFCFEQQQMFQVYQVGRYFWTVSNQSNWILFFLCFYFCLFSMYFYFHFKVNVKFTTHFIWPIISETFNSHNHDMHSFPICVFTYEKL